MKRAVWAALLAWLLMLLAAPAVWPAGEAAGSALATFGPATEPLVVGGEPYRQIRPLVDRMPRGVLGGSVAIGPGGLVATGTSDGRIRLWDLASGRERARLEGHQGGVSSVAFSPDGRTLASGSEDRTVRLWDLASGRERARLEGHQDAVLSVAFSPDGRAVASGSWDKTVRLWDLATARERARLEGHQGGVRSVVFSPDGRTLASGSGDKTVRLWDLASGREQVRLEGHQDAVWSVAFSRDGRTLASGSADRTVRLWDLPGGRERARLEGHQEAVWSVAFGLDGRTLASGSGDRTVRFWDVATGRERARLEGHRHWVLSIAFSPDDRTLATGSADSTVRLWDLATGRERARLEGHQDWTLAVVFSPEGRTLATASGDGTIRLWDVAGGRERARLEGHQGPVRSVAFSPDGRMLASGSDDRTIRVWDLANGRESRLEGHQGAVQSVAFSPNGRTLASGSDDKTVRLWDLSSGRERARLEGHQFPVRSVAFSPEGDTVASGSWDKTVRLWDVARARERARLEGHQGAVQSVAFSPDGRTLATGSWDETVRLWNPASGRERVRLQGHLDRIQTVAFSPDGRTLASGSDDKTVLLWDLASGRVRARLKDHRAGVLAVAFSADHRFFASGSADGTARLWDPDTLAELGLFAGSSNGQWLACRLQPPVCERRDFGTLVAAPSQPEPAGESGLAVPVPPGDPQPLLAQPLGIPATGQWVTTDAPATFTFRISNPGRGPAYWLSLSATDDADPPRYAAETARWMRLDAQQSVDVALRVHFHPARENPQRFDVSLRPVLAQAHGARLVLPPIHVSVVPPTLTLDGAALVGEGEQRSLSVALNNGGSAIGALVLQAAVGGTTLPTAASLSSFPSGSQRTVSFGWDPKIPVRDGPPTATLTIATQPGWPIHDWRYENVPIATPGLPVAVWLGAAALALVLAGWVYVQRIYRHPLVVELTAAPEALRRLDPQRLDDAALRLKRAGRLDAVLAGAAVEAPWLDQAAGFDRDGDTPLEALAARLAARWVRTPEGAWLQFDASFPLNLLRVRVHRAEAADVPQDLYNRLRNTPEVTLLLGRGEAQRRALAGLVRAQPGLLVAPDGAALADLLLARDPREALARLVARQVPVTQVSPYQTGGGVHRASMFFGRDRLIAQVVGRDPANYLIVGGRQLGKSSLLKELARRYRGDPGVSVHEIVLADGNAVAPLAHVLGLPGDGAAWEDIAAAVVRERPRRTLFVIDEADEFLKAEGAAGYPALQQLRALSEQGHAQFILAGFWSLYRLTMLDYQSPLKNFGTVLTIGALEPEACIALAEQPMARLGIGWADRADIERLVHLTGRRANLISIACERLVETLGPTERMITTAMLDAVLDDNRLRGQLEGWGQLGETDGDRRLDRIVAYATVREDRFTLPELLVSLEARGLAADPETVKQSVQRLELAFVLLRRGGAYRYAVPLQRDLILEMDPEAALEREIRAAH